MCVSECVHARAFVCDGRISRDEIGEEANKKAKLNGPSVYLSTVSTRPVK